MNKNRALPLNHLDDGTFIQDTAEILAICENVGLSPEIAEDITGAVIYLDESGADYKMIYLSESNAPYAFDAVYHPLPFYREGNYNPNMPIYWKWFIYF
jgi:hypothetical protein